MKLKIDRGQLYLLNAIIRGGDQLWRQLLLDGGAVGPQGRMPVELYKAKDDTGQRQMIALQRWMEKKVLVPSPDVLGNFDNPEFPSDDEDATITVGLKKAYCDRVNEMLGHYKQVGRLASVVKPYVRLKDQLDGKTTDIDDAWEDDDAEEATLDTSPPTEAAN